MDIMYKIVGTKVQGEKVVLELKSVDPEEQTTTTGIIKDPMGFLQKQKDAGISARDPERIKIPVDEWKKEAYNLGNMITVNIKPMGG